MFGVLLIVSLSLAASTPSALQYGTGAIGFLFTTSSDLIVWLSLLLLVPHKQRGIVIFLFAVVAPVAALDTVA